MGTAILQVRHELVVVVGVLRGSMGFEVDGVAIEAGSVEKGVPDGDLVIGFPLGEIEGVRGTGGSRRMVVAVGCDGGHVPGVDEGGCDVRPAWDGGDGADGETGRGQRRTNRGSGDQALPTTDHATGVPPRPIYVGPDRLQLHRPHSVTVSRRQAC